MRLVITYYDGWFREGLPTPFHYTFHPWYAMLKHDKSRQMTEQATQPLRLLVFVVTKQIQEGRIW